MGFTLVSIKKADGSIVISVPLLLRLGMVALALILFASATLSPESGKGFSPGLLVALLIALLGALYEERWTFDRPNRTVQFRFGLVFLARRVRVPFDQVESLVVERFVKGKIPGAAEAEGPENSGQERRAYYNLVLYLTNGGRLVVETVKGRNMRKIEKLRDDLLELGLPGGATLG
jgi:hypothetical protein